MSAVDEIINYQRSADEDLYGLLNCTEQATVSVADCLFVLVFISGCNFAKLICGRVSVSPAHSAWHLCERCYSVFAHAKRKL